MPSHYRQADGSEIPIVHPDSGAADGAPVGSVRWAVNHQPGSGVQGTVSRAAGGGTVRHVCTAILLTFSADTTAPTAAARVWYLRDGASGGGTVLWAGAMSMQALAGFNAPPVVLAGLNIVGSPNTPMTLEFNSGGPVNTYMYVSMAGYDLPS